MINNLTTKASCKIKLNPNRKKYSTFKYNNKYIEGITRLKQKISILLGFYRLKLITDIINTLRGHNLF